MKVVTYAVMDMESLQWIPESEVSYEYSGSVALCDRAAVSQANNLVNTAKTTAGQYGQNASTEGNLVRGFDIQNLTSPQGFGQQGVREMLTSAMAGTGGGDASLTGDAAEEEARRRNTGGYSSALDEVSRNRMKTDAMTGEKIAASDVGLKQQQQQEAAKNLTGMYGIDTSSLMKSMGLENEAINTGVKAQETGWFQNLMKGIETMSGAAKTVMTGGTGGGTVFSG